MNGNTIVLMLAALIFTVWAQVKVQSTFEKYSAVASARGFSASAVARQILDRNGLGNIRIERVSGKLSDHYDPKAGVIRLSESVHDSTSVAAIGVAAHECGHAVQYAKNYAPIKVRAAIIPITNIGSKLAWPLILAGFLFEFLGLAYLGVAFFSLSAVFQLVTLPVEFNASSRALATLSDEGMLYDEELTGAKKVLSAAAMTYVAALAVSIVNVLRMLTYVNSRKK